MSNQPVIERAITLRANPQSVWEAISQPENLRQWFAENLETDLRVGGDFKFWGGEVPGSPDRQSAGQTLLALKPPTSIEIAWPIDGACTQLEMRVEPDGERSRVVMRHTIPDPSDEHIRWTAIDSMIIRLYNLREFVESGKTLLQFNLHDRSDRLTTVVTIQAPPGDVWEALTIPAKMNDWIATEAKVDLDKGEYSYGWQEDGGPLEGPGRVLDVEPGRRLVMDWNHQGSNHSQVEWLIEGQGGATKLTLTHSGFTPDMTFEGHMMGWNAFMGAIKSYVEGRSLAAKASV